MKNKMQHLSRLLSYHLFTFVQSQDQHSSRISNYVSKWKKLLSHKCVATVMFISPPLEPWNLFLLSIRLATNAAKKWRNGHQMDHIDSEYKTSIQNIFLKFYHCWKHWSHFQEDVRSTVRNSNEMKRQM